MRKSIVSLLAVLLVLSLTVFGVHAQADRLDDGASLLFGSEERNIRQMLDEISTRQGVDLVIVTTDSLEGKTPMEYADDYYDYGGYRPDGILLLVSMEDRDWWISTKGYGITAITDAGLQYISDRFVPYLSDEEYGEAFEIFAQLCDEFITQAKTGDPYDTHNLPKEPFDVTVSLLIALAVGLVVTLIITGKMKRELKSVRQQAKADDYIAAGSLQLTQSRDLFLYTHLDRQERPKSSSGSSTHVSSSGSTHGGGGGKF